MIKSTSTTTTDSTNADTKTEKPKSKITEPFKPKWEGDFILNKYDIATDINTDIIYIYDNDNGYYKRNNSERILNYRVNLRLGDYTNTHKVNEIVNYIKRQTYKDLSLLRNSDYICLSNGILNLKNIKLEKHTSSKFIPYRIPVKYDKHVDVEPWLKYVEGLVKPYDIDTVQESNGNLFANHYITKKLIYALGPNDSGKSTFFDIMQSFLTRQNYSSLTLHQLAEKFTNAALYEKRANICSDIPYKLKMKHIGIIKCFTGGDVVTIQFKHKDAFEFMNIAKFFFSGNGIPVFDYTQVDDAYYRRWQFIEFPNHFSKDDSVLPKYTTDEMKSAILNWMIEGYQRLKKNKWYFTNETSIDEVKEIFKSGVYVIDNFDKWITECCEISNKPISKAELFRDCRDWHIKQKLFDYPININSFGIKINQQRFFNISDCYPRDGDKRIHCYRGIKVK